MTTLELARSVANAVILCGPQREPDSTKDRQTQAVLSTLRESGHWFCRLHDGGMQGTQEIQLEMFP